MESTDIIQCAHRGCRVSPKRAVQRARVLRPSRQAAAGAAVSARLRAAWRAYWLEAELIFAQWATMRAELAIGWYKHRKAARA